MMFYIYLLTFLIQLLAISGLSCIADDGKPVEWFVGYKFPNGLNYAVFDGETKTWKKSDHLINENGMLKYSYSAMYALRQSENGVYGVYNDEKPELMAYSYWWGHMKGAFAFDSSSGIWLIHSIPKLSQLNGTYSYPESGKVYGQHFLCVTLPSSALLPIVTQLAVARPLFQDFYLAPMLAEKYPQIVKLLNNKDTTTDIQSVQVFHTLDGTLEMKHFSKSLEFGKDLYADLVAPSLGLGLYVETWTHGRNEPSVCNKSKPAVFNVKYLAFPCLDEQFPSANDHSKWAVTTAAAAAARISKKEMWTCLGDINRQYTQFHRGGGTLCMKNGDLWNAFNSLIIQLEPCNPHQK